MIHPSIAAPRTIPQVFSWQPHVQLKNGIAIGLGTNHPILVTGNPVQPIHVYDINSLRGRIPGTPGGPPLSARKPGAPIYSAAFGKRPINSVAAQVAHPITSAKLPGPTRMIATSGIAQGGGGGEDWPVLPGTTLQDLADMGHLDDSAMMTVLERQTVSLMSAPTSHLYLDVENIWNAILQGIKDGAAKGLAIGLSVVAVDVALGDLGFTALADILAALVAEIAAAISAAVIAAGGSAFVTSVAAGGTFGYVGAIIGAIIGACIAIGTVLYGGQHCQITGGQTYSCKDYVSTNVPNASKWLHDNQDKIEGLTAARFAEQAALFLANPTWLYVNRHLTGLDQPPPPDPGSGDALDMVYTQVPGAFELLNRAQFMKAIVFVNVSAGHLKECASIPNPVQGGAKFYGDPNGAAYGQQGVKGAGVYPDPDPDKYGWIYATSMQCWAPGNSGNCVDTVIPGSAQVYATWQASYSAPPNLVTNKNTYKGQWPDGQGKIDGQTDQCPGIYFLQVLYPTLTTVQCELIFDHAQKNFGPVPSLMPTTTPTISLPGLTPSGNPSFAAPLPPHRSPPPLPPPPPGGIFPPGTHMASFGPTAAGIAAMLAAMKTNPAYVGSPYGIGTGFDPFGAASLLAMNKGNPVGAAIAAQQLTQKTSPSLGGFMQPATPAQAIATISQIGALSKQAGGLSSAQAQQLADMKNAIAHTVQQAAVGHPVAAFNAKVLDAAHRLSVAAEYVGKYVSPNAAQTILHNAGYAGLPLGSGKYDRNLPLVLEQTVDRMLYDPTATTADLQLFAESLVQAA